MDRAVIEELFAYTDYAWREYTRAIRALGDPALTRPVPGSGWPSFREALAHLNFAYDRWLADPAGTSARAVDVQALRSWDDVEGDRKRVRDLFRGYFDSLSDAELMAPREMNIDGDMLAFSPADIFTHVLLHERGHHGDLSTLLYQVGVEPPVVEYRLFLMESRT